MSLTTNVHQFRALNRSYEIATLGGYQAIYGYEYSKDTHKLLHDQKLWIHGALTKIAQGMENQHKNMRQHLQDRHLAMESNIGEDTNEAHNALGEAIMEAQNSNGQGITDAQNAMSDQHNRMLGWLHNYLCLIYVAMNGNCLSLIGPLQEDQVHIPLDLHWPEGQQTVMKKMRNVKVMSTERQSKWGLVSLKSLWQMKQEQKLKHSRRR